MLPLKMKRNRVWRLYYGGRLIDEMRGEAEPTDGSFPEDWLASVVRADNPDRPGKPADEGLSVIDGGSYDGRFLRDVILSDPVRMLGEKHIERLGSGFGVLTKFLDSSERLPVQCHPTKETAKRLFDSEYGKTESWYILGGRAIDGEEPHILLGFKDKLTKPELKKLFDEQDIDAVMAHMNKIPVRAGDVFLIKGGMPHAIGPGCFLLEVQEPTDYTISLEKRDLRGNLMPDHLCHMGLGFDRMFDCFDYDVYPAERVISEFRLNKNSGRQTGGNRFERLISYEDTPCFALDRLTLREEFTREADGRASCIAVSHGECRLTDGEESLHLRPGDCLFEPAGRGGYKFVPITDEAEILFCLPPEI